MNAARSILTGRGKRLWGSILFVFWGVLTWRVAAGITGGALDEPQLAALNTFYWTATATSAGTATVLWGLDVAQFLPWLKGKDE